MAGTNQFKAFATGGSAYTLTAADYAALTDFLANGFPSGIVDGARFNTVLRQACMASSALGKIVSDANLDALDNGDVSTLAARISSALVTPAASTAVAGKSRFSTNLEAMAGSLATISVTPNGLKYVLNTLLGKRAFLDNDFIRIPDEAGGLIVQWGIISALNTDATSADISFPVTFPSAVLHIGTSHLSSRIDGASLSACSVKTGYTTSAFKLMQDTGIGGGVSEFWFAIGF